MKVKFIVRDPGRIDKITEKLNRLWHKYPDWRLGQLIENLKPRERDLFYVEDTELEEYIGNVPWVK